LVLLMLIKKIIWTILSWLYQNESRRNHIIWQCTLEWKVLEFTTQWFKYQKYYWNTISC
jgi:hypothetical protein